MAVAVAFGPTEDGLVVDAAAAAADIINAFRFVSFISDKFDVDAHSDDVTDGSDELLPFCDCRIEQLLLLLELLTPLDVEHDEPVDVDEELEHVRMRGDGNSC